MTPLELLRKLEAFRHIVANAPKPIIDHSKLYPFKCYDCGFMRFSTPVTVLYGDELFYFCTERCAHPNAPAYMEIPK